MNLTPVQEMNKALEELQVMTRKYNYLIDEMRRLRDAAFATGFQKCRGLCKFADFGISSRRPYVDGNKYCTECDKGMPGRYHKCPCCFFRLRTKPRQK